MDCERCVFILNCSQQTIHFCVHKNIFRGRMNDVNNEPTPAKPAQPCRWNPVNWLPFLLYYPFFFFSFFPLDVQKCNIRRSRAETQHECLPGILSMAKNNLILSGSVKILFAWLWCASLCLSVLWQARRHVCRLPLKPEQSQLKHFIGAELKHATFTFSQRCDKFVVVDHSHRGRPCFLRFLKSVENAPDAF